MQNRDIYLMILGMTLVTYLPRVLPAFLMGRIRLSARVEHFLQLIPYTAMTALVFPGVFSVDANPVLGVVGAAVAGGLAWKKCPIIVCVLAAVAVEAVMLLLRAAGCFGVWLWSRDEGKNRQSARCRATSYCTQFLPSIK